MAFSLVPLLIHDEAVPERVREALRAAHRAPLDRRAAELEAAARSLFMETELDCRDVRDLVGLPLAKCV